jgi:hypothetical protein
MNYNECDRKQSWPNFSPLSYSWLCDLRRATRQVSPDSPSAGQDLDLRFPSTKQAFLLDGDLQSIVNSILVDEDDLSYRLTVYFLLVSRQDIYGAWSPPPISWSDADRLAQWHQL